jgi:hypothetical protein
MQLKNLPLGFSRYKATCYYNFGKKRRVLLSSGIFNYFFSIKTLYYTYIMGHSAENMEHSISRGEFIRLMAWVSLITAVGCSGIAKETSEIDHPTEVRPIPTDKPTVTKTPIPATDTPEPTEDVQSKIELLKKWGSEVMGECGVPYPETIELTSSVDNMIIASDGTVSEKSSDYQLQAGETKLKCKVIKDFNDSKQVDLKGNKVSFNEAAAGILLYKIGGKNSKGNEAEAPFLMLYQTDPRDPINNVNTFIGFGLTKKGEAIPPGEEGEGAKTYVRVLKKGSLTDGGKITLGVPLSNDPLTEEGKTMAPQPLFEISKDNQGKINVEFTIPPFLDVLQANINNHPEVPKKIEIAQDSNNIKAMAVLVKNDSTLNEAKADLSRQEKADEQKNLIERNSLENKREQIVQSINEFFKNPDSYKEGDKPYLTDSGGEALSLNYYKIGYLDPIYEGGYIVRITNAELAPVFLEYFIKNKNLYYVFGAKNANNQPFVWTGITGTIGKNWPLDKTALNFLNPKKIKYEDARMNDSVKQCTEVLQILESIEIKTQVLGGASYIDTDSNYFKLGDGNFFSFTSEQFAQLVDEYANKDAVVGLINYYRGIRNKKDYIIGEGNVVDYNCPDRSPAFGGLTVFNIKK